MPSSITQHVLISGKVHGVGFRAGLQHRAQASNIKGWCRNLPDGRVEAILSGAEEALDVVLFWCHQGPPAAQVDAVVVHHISPEKDYADFEILETPASW